MIKQQPAKALPLPQSNKTKTKNEISCFLVMMSCYNAVTQKKMRKILFFCWQIKFISYQSTEVFLFVAVSITVIAATT